MIEARDLTKHYGSKLAVDHLSFRVTPGKVTGFLGPNGAGKSTTMRLLLGLDRPDAGTATINGKRYAQLSRPLRTVGALLEARSMHPGRSAYNHLLFLAQTQGLPRRRVDEVLALVGLSEVAHRRVGGYSLGMNQRVGIAAAMLADPSVLMLDEPVNGLDPEGIRWIRNLMKQLAAEGRAVFVSSHLMNEMAVTADHLIVIGRGRLIADCPTQDFIERSSGRSVLVRTPAVAALSRLVTANGGTVTPEQAAAGGPPAPQPARRAPALVVTGMEAARIGELATAARIVLHELTPRLASLEDAFMESTAASLEYARHGEQPADGAHPTDGAPPAGRETNGQAAAGRDTAGGDETPGGDLPSGDGWKPGGARRDSAGPGGSPAPGRPAFTGAGAGTPAGPPGAAPGERVPAARPPGDAPSGDAPSGDAPPGGLISGRGEREWRR